jgi:hypothetical protein
MLSTRTYLAISMVLSLLFHLLLFTVANKIPAFQEEATILPVTKKKKIVRLRSVKDNKLSAKQKPKRLNLKLRKNPSRLSAALNPTLSKNTQKTIKPIKPNPNDTKLLGSPNVPLQANSSSPKNLPPKFYHIEVKAPTKTSSAENKRNVHTPQLTIKAPSINVQSGSSTNQSKPQSKPQVSLRRSLPRITPSAINFKRPSITSSSRKINSPIKNIKALGGNNKAPIQMENFLNITPYIFVDTIDQMGYFKLELRINQSASGLHPIEKDTYFIIDSSRSITRKQLTEFVRGTINSFSSLNAKDRFNPVIFTTKATKAFPEFKEVSPESIKEARDFLSFFRIFSGRTDIYNSILPFINNTNRENNRPLQVFLMTDGVSTVEQSKESSQIIREITSNNKADISIFGFSCGDQNNSFLIDFLTFRNRGDSLIVDQVEKASTNLTRYITDRSEIIVTDLVSRYNGSYNQDIFPKKLPHLYRNRPLTIYGKFNVNDKTSVIQLLGKSSSGERQLVYKINFEEARQASPELAKTWAAQKIFHLIGQLTDTPDQKIITEIHSLQQRFKVYIPYTLPKVNQPK